MFAIGFALSYMTFSLIKKEPTFMAVVNKVKERVPEPVYNVYRKLKIKADVIKLTSMFFGKVLMAKLELQYRNTFGWWTYTRQISKNSYDVVYYLNNKLYKMRVKLKRGPAPVLMITTEENIDITNNVLEYAGPEYNFHGVPITPSFFGANRLIMEMADGTTHVFDKTTFIPPLDKI